MRTCCIVLPLAPLRVGDRIDRRAWAPHVTLVGDLRLPDGATDTAAAVLREAAAATPPLTATVGEEALFGPDRSVLVDLVGSPRPAPLHDRLLSALEQHVDGLEVVAPAWTRQGYRPHRTVVPGDRPARGETITAREIALVELDPPASPGTGVVIARWGLGAAAHAEEIGPADVLEVVAALRDAAVPAWVIGGWGVDALLAEATRLHHDVDLFVEANRTEEAIAALAGLGFVVRFVWSENRWSEGDGRLVPSAFVAIDVAGREVDVHTVRYDAGRVLPRSASTVDLPLGALDATGRIGGEPVPCASAAAQLVMHTGYSLPDRQLGDVEHLRRLA